MDSDLDLIVDLLKHQRRWLVLVIVLCFVMAVWNAIDLIQGKGWGQAVISLWFGVLTFVLWRFVWREGIFHPETSPLLHTLTERPDDVVWVQYKAEAIEPFTSTSWRAKLTASWRNARIKVHLLDNRSFSLMSDSKEARALLQVLQKRVPHADFGDSKEMKERYEARVKAWREAELL